MFEEMDVTFSKPPDCILRDEETLSHPGGEWLPGAYINPAKNCLSINRKRNLDDTTIIWRDEGKDDHPLNKMTLNELRSQVWYNA